MSLEQFVRGEELGKDNPEMGKRYSAPHPGDVIILETNFEFHLPHRHNAVITATEECGVEIRTLPLRVTGKKTTIMRIARGEPGKNHDDEQDRIRASRQASILKQLADAGITVHDDDDFNAVEAIRIAYKGGAAWARPRWYADVQLSDWQMYNRLRTGKEFTYKHEWVRAVTEGFPSHRELYHADRDVARFFGTDEPAKTDRADRLSRYAVSLLVSTIITARQAQSRDEFDRLMGLYGHGYPSIRRSNVTRRIESLSRSEAKERGISLGGLHVALDHRATEAHAIIRKNRTIAKRSVRYVYHWTHATPGNRNSEMGKT